MGFWAAAGQDQDGFPITPLGNDSAVAGISRWAGFFVIQQGLASAH